jgi:hypothetical protein
MRSPSFSNDIHELHKAPSAGFARNPNWMREPISKQEAHHELHGQDADCTNGKLQNPKSQAPNPKQKAI